LECIFIKNTMTRFKKHIARSLALMAVVARMVATPADAIPADKPEATPGSTAIQPAIVVNVAATGALDA